MARILVWDDKHGEHVYDASTEDLLHGASLDILQNRVDNEYIDCHGPSDYYTDKYAEWDLTDEEIEALPTESLRKTALAGRKNYRNAVAENVEAEEMIESVYRALRERNGVAAYRILQARSDYEYEGIYFENIKSITPDEVEVTV